MPENNKKKKITINRAARQNIIVIAALIVVWAFFSIKSPYFLKWNNMLAILIAAVPLGLVAISESLCVMTGGFDMSVGMVACLSGIIWTTLISAKGIPTYLALLVSLVFGTASGVLAGLSVSKLKMPPWMTTYALMNIWKGLTLIITDGEAVRMTTFKTFKFLGQYKIFGTEITPMVIIMVLIFILMYLFLKYTKLGRDMYVVGGNTEAAKNVGIKVDRSILFAFTASGFLAALAGALFASRSGSGQPAYGALLAMQGIASCTIGGTAAGKTNVAMTLVGVLFIMGMQNGLNMIQVPAFYQYITTGIVLVLAIFVQTERRK